jgi:hypothetical protein
MPQDEEYRRTYVSATSVKAIRRLMKDAHMTPEEYAALRRLTWAWECGDYDPGYEPPSVRGEVSPGQMLLDEEILAYALKGLVLEEANAVYGGPYRRRTDEEVAA